MSCTDVVGAMSGLMKEANELSENFGKLIVQIDGLLLDAHTVDSEIVYSIKYRHDQVMKHLAEHVEGAMDLRDNLDLKATVEEYHAGVHTIVTKYKEHCQGDMLLDSYNIREKYMAALQEVVNKQDERIERMLDVIKAVADMTDLEGNENEELIRRLLGENEMMRRQLQISNDGTLPQGLGSNQTNETATQSDLNDWNCDDTSMESFMTCLSQGSDESDSSSNSSVVSQIEVDRFIEEALGKDNDTEQTVSNSQ